MGMFRVEYLLLGILVIGVRSRDIPNCDFFDTVQLRESEKLCNGSYRYEDVVIPAKLTGKYDYEIDYDGDRVSVPKHIRLQTEDMHPVLLPPQKANGRQLVLPRRI